MQLASRFVGTPTSLRSHIALTDEQIHRIAPSIFAKEKHSSRSQRYTYIPTIEILQGLRKEGFRPFMVCQSRARTESKREHTKHMIRLRHETQIDGDEANEVILLNSHDGTSAYQMLAGVFRFVCANGMVCGEIINDVRVRHSGKVLDNVIEGAFRVMNDFALLDTQKEQMKSLTLTGNEQLAFARAALALRYDPEQGAAPVAEQQLLIARRPEDIGDDLWRTLNRVQENMLAGGLSGRSPGGRASRTRPILAIDQTVRLNHGLWVLAEEIQRLKLDCLLPHCPPESLEAIVASHPINREDCEAGISTEAKEPVEREMKYVKPTKEAVRRWLGKLITGQLPPPSISEIQDELWYVPRAQGLKDGP